ncbi:GNAT family N-acetyltransferase [Paenibacillus sp. LHD-117]|uniref:GNAT family N-acetyltransferase n=1 Tax=Paenibacillus sp. LHD-117 TaxID=3071412 RepID=UPI0027DEDC92|nr:GNAT family N-acetyltransferase [Paenibacillus sp. LHD-117]MDQ6419465.1 GNAT family N-acetyltransferase [Paenibacillus sp. LHD-117]
MGERRNVAVLVYEGVDSLDVTGPFDVFAVASDWGRDFHVYTVGMEKSAVRTVSGLTLMPTYGARDGDCPDPDILVIPGGWGARKEMYNAELTEWIGAECARAELTLSVCTGALLLAKAGVLEGLRATTNRRAMELLREAAPASATIVEDVRYVDNGRIVLSAGVTAGIDAALYIVSKLHGEERATDTASKLEYEWHREPNACAGDVRKPLHIRRARADDVDRLRGLLCEAARWIRAEHGFWQWREEMFTAERVSAYVASHEMFVAFRGGELVGCFSVHWAYEEIWGEQFHDDAGYVHRLAVARSCKGEGIGSELLAFAEQYIREKGKRWMRLDCMADNPGLNRYYERSGFILKGRFDGEGWSANLYEKELRREGATP